MTRLLQPTSYRPDLDGGTKVIERVPEQEVMRALQRITDGASDVGSKNCAMSALHDYQAAMFGRISDLAAALTSSRNPEIWKPANEIWKIAASIYPAMVEKQPAEPEPRP